MIRNKDSKLQKRKCIDRVYIKGVECFNMDYKKKYSFKWV